jgi:predicted RNA-binding protein Jag
MGLFSLAILIIAVSLWYTNMLVTRFAQNERINVKVWANTIQRKANLVNYANHFFDQVKEEEKKRAQLLADTYKRIPTENNSRDLTFYLNIIRNNTTIPLVLTDTNGNIISSVNVNFDQNKIKILEGNLKDEFSIFDSIMINYSPTNQNILYYKESIIYTELRQVLNDLIESFFSEIVENSVSVPVVVIDSLQNKILAFGNIDSIKMQNPQYVKKIIHQMKIENEVIQIQLSENGTSFIYYKNSSLLTQIKYYPYVQFTVIGFFFLIAYLLFSVSRRSEQNQVWVGMSKETAHQLGTPLSSIIAWIEILKMKETDPEILSEIEKDLARLQNITERFSKIGSPPILEKRNVVEIIYDSIEYIKKRTSKKINYSINLPKNSVLIVPINKPLFEWVVENICKNAVDAMNGSGTLKINIKEVHKNIVLDFIDSGKGLAKSNFKTVFNPGYTSKNRGWGLGLSLSKRIIKNYHKGKIFVKASTINRGTTFRIVLQKRIS